MQTHICAIFVHLDNDAEFINWMCFFNNWMFVSVISLNIVEIVWDCSDISPITTAHTTEDVGVCVVVCSRLCLRQINKILHHTICLNSLETTGRYLGL